MVNVRNNAKVSNPIRVVFQSCHIQGPERSGFIGLSLLLHSSLLLFPRYSMSLLLMYGWQEFIPRRIQVSW